MGHLGVQIWLFFRVLLALGIFLSPASAAPHQTASPKNIRMVSAVAGSQSGASGTQTQIKSELLGLYLKLHSSRSASMARKTERKIAQTWLKSGDSVSDQHMRNAVAAIAQRDFRTARTLLDAVIARQPHHADAWTKRAAVNFSEGRYHRSLSDLKNALALDHLHFQAVHVLGSLLRKMGHPREALSAYKWLRRLYPAHPEAGAAIRALLVTIDGKAV